MDFFTKDLAAMSDRDLCAIINAVNEERRNRERAANRKLIDDFKRAANALAEANICYYIGYQGEDIYLGDASDYHFDY